MSNETYNAKLEAMREQLDARTREAACAREARAEQLATEERARAERAREVDRQLRSQLVKSARRSDEYMDKHYRAMTRIAELKGELGEARARIAELEAQLAEARG